MVFKKVLHITDTHFDYVDDLTIKEDFIVRVLKEKASIILLGGDLGIPLDELDDFMGAIKGDSEVYFVLGNHDYYNYYIRDAVRLAESMKNGTYLSDKYFFEVYANGCVKFLIGTDGWGDCSFNDYLPPTNDYAHINDYVHTSSELKLRIARNQGLHQASVISRQLGEIEEHIRNGNKVVHVYILTHVPPFLEMCKYGTEPTDERLINAFCSKELGSVIERFADANPEVKVSIYSGHTHSYSVYRKNNILGCVPHTPYGKPTYNLFMI
jgi:predicted MPP superfamily phosphohydrolase